MDRVSTDTTTAAVNAAMAGHHEALSGLPSMAGDLAAAASVLVETLGEGGQVLVCGNGGSAADAQHIAAELVGRFEKDRDAWPAIALHTNTSALTSIGNDYGFDEVFARQVRAHGRAGDALIAISTSGKSPNVVAAVGAARDRGMRVIGLTGSSPGPVGDACDVCIAVPSASTPRVQEAHIMIAHVLCGLVEDALS